MRPTPRAIALVLLSIVAACGKPATPSSSPTSPSLNGEWSLLELNGQAAPAGNGGRRATLRFVPDSMRVAGFAGCNSLSARLFTLGDSISVGAAIMTRMACAEGMDVEQRLAAALTAAQRFQVTATDLTLLGATGPVAKFTRVAP